MRPRLASGRAHAGRGDSEVEFSTSIAPNPAVMSFRALPIVLFAGAACGDPDAESETSQACDPQDRNGTYAVTAMRVEGDCAELRPFTTEIIGETGQVTALSQGRDCTVQSAGYSEQGCRLDLAFESQVTSDVVGTYSGFATANEDASRLSGQLTYVSDFGDGDGCAATYDFEMVRQ